MRKICFAALFLLSLWPMLAIGQSPFDGTWKIDVNNVQYPIKPDVFLLQNGMYECKTCVPKISVKADGTDQKVTDDPYSDSISVKLVDDHNFEMTRKKDGKVVGTSKNSISADGKALTIDWTDSGNPSGGMQTGTFTQKRVAKGPAAAHLISGSWVTEKGDASPDALTWTYKLNGDELSFSTPLGQSYTAKIDGTEAPFKGDPGTTSVSVKKLGKDTLQESFKRDGKVTGLRKLTLSGDGKTAKLVYEDKLAGTTVKAEAVKQ
jgi:hypothetical protein